MFDHAPVACQQSAKVDVASTSLHLSCSTRTILIFAAELHNTHVAWCTRWQWIPAYCEDVKTVPDAGQCALSHDTPGQTGGQMGAAR